MVTAGDTLAESAALRAADPAVEYSIQSCATIVAVADTYCDFLQKLCLQVIMHEERLRHELLELKLQL